MHVENKLIVMVFLEYLDLQLCTFSQVSPIHFAAANDKLDDVQSLVAADVKIVESKDEKQVRTPLDNVIHSDCDASYLFQLYGCVLFYY